MGHANHDSGQLLPGSDRLMTVRALSRHFGLTEKRIRSAMRSGELRSYLIGSWRRSSLADAREWLEGLRFQPNDEMHPTRSDQRPEVPRPAIASQRQGEGRARAR